MQTKAETIDLSQNVVADKVYVLPASFVNHPDLVREVLVERARDCHKTPRQYSAAELVIGRGLIISEDEEHHRLGKLLAPVFQDNCHLTREGRGGGRTAIVQLPIE